MPVDPFALTTHFSQPPADDYDSIHATVMETARGRWFLQEYARRNRNADTRLLLAAVRRLESALNIQTAIPGSSHGAGRHDGQTLIVKYIKESVTPLTQRLRELHDSILLTRAGLPTIESSGRKASVRPDFDQVAKGISVVAARMRWIAEQVSHKQRQAMASIHDDLDKLAEGTTMITALLGEVELRIGALIETMQAYAEAEAEVTATAVMDQPAAAQAAAPVQAAPPVQEQASAAALAPSPQPAAAATIAAQPLLDESDAAAPLKAPASPPQAPAAPPPPDMRWLDMLAPVIVGPTAAATPEPVQFDMAEEPRPVIAMPNPAQRETVPEEPRAELTESAPPPLEPQAVEPAASAPQPVPTPATFAPEPAAPKAPEIPIADLIQRLVQEAVVGTIKETIEQAMAKTPVQAPIQVPVQAPAPVAAPAPVITAAPPPSPAISVAPPPASPPAPAQQIVATPPAPPSPALPPMPVTHITAPAHHDEHREDPSAFAFDLFSMMWHVDHDPAPAPVEQPRPQQEERQAEARPVEQRADVRFAEAMPPAAAMPVVPAPEPQPVPAPATILHMPPKANGAAKPATPPAAIAKPNGPLASIMALSDEEKIALFS